MVYPQPFTGPSLGSASFTLHLFMIMLKKHLNLPLNNTSIKRVKVIKEKH